MINRICYYLQRTEKGWDPIPESYAKKYAQLCYESPDILPTVEKVEKFVEGLHGKTLLDLGAGPGQYTREFIKKGAKVTWQDISTQYLTIFKKENPDLPVTIQQGYLEEAEGEYDVVFNRVCSCYAINDKKFFHLLCALIKPKGYGYCVIPTEKSPKFTQKSFLNKSLRKIQFYLNNWLGIKIGHPFITPKHLKKIFSAINLQSITFEKINDNIMVVKIIK